MTKIQKLIIPISRENKENGTTTLKDTLLVSYRANQSPAITVLGIFLTGLKMYVHIKLCKWIYIVGFFIIAKNRSNQDVFQ